MKWVLAIIVALVLCWAWRNRRRLTARAPGILAGSSGPGEAGDKGGILPAPVGRPTETSKPGPDALPDCLGGAICD